MKTKHTKGEWAFDDNEVYSESTDHGAAICTMNTTSAHFTEDEMKANAKLIAAAPELLDALQELITLYYTPEDGYISPYKEAWEKANAAIKKATS